MPFVVVWAISNFIVQMLRTLRTMRSNKPKSMCVDCTFAHIQYAVNGRCATSCTFNGGVRPVALDVLYCTDYRARNAVVVIRPIGFLPVAQKEEQLAEVAISK